MPERRVTAIPGGGGKAAPVPRVRRAAEAGAKQGEPVVTWVRPGREANEWPRPSR